MATISTGYTKEKLFALQSAIAEGITKVKYSDKEVEYRSLKDMLKLEDKMKKELGLSDCSGKDGLFGGKRLKMQHSKGL